MQEFEEISTDGDDYYVIPEEAFQYLPREWRDQFQAIADDGRTVLKSVDPELSKLMRLSNSFATLVTLKHIRQRLADYKFSPEMEGFLELDMLTTAFVVTYARLAHGGNGSGFSRNELPAPLRAAHDEILDLRNKRFAHNDAHHSVENAMEIDFKDGRFAVQFNLRLGFYIGGANDWHELVDFLDSHTYSRLEKLFERLGKKTDREWAFPTGPGPG
ncbi:MAG: hypothetical protein Q7T19_10660 [Caulobacter sp.]|nr:hypothetical protein [Caulobacter sp.]